MKTKVAFATTISAAMLIYAAILITVLGSIPGVDINHTIGNYILALIVWWPTLWLIAKFYRMEIS